MKCKKYYPGLPQSRGTCLPVHIHLQVIFIKSSCPHKKLIQGASQREGTDPLWGVQPTRHPSRVSPTIPSSHWCLICAMHNVYALFVDLCNLCSYWCHHLSSCEFAYMHWKPNVRSLCFKSRSNWVSAHVSIFSKLSQGDQMCGQIWAMSPKNPKLRKIWPTIRSWANLAKCWCRQIRQLVKQAPPGLFNTKSTWLLDYKLVHKK